MSEAVYLPSSTNNKSADRRYHTDEGCHRLALAESVLEKPQAVIDQSIPECAVCSGEHDPAQNSDPRGTRRALLEMDPESVGGGQGA